jgi:peroxiredoxin
VRHEHSTPPADVTPPSDDGGAARLPGCAIPALTLESSLGPVDLAELAAERAVVYLFPRAGPPGSPTPPGWDAIPGARGCTAQSCAFRDHAAELAALGARVAGLSAQTLDDQRAFARRNGIPFPLLADPGLRLARLLGFPTFAVSRMTLYRRLTFVAEHGVIRRVFYPVEPPDRNAADVVRWLRRRGSH